MKRALSLAFVLAALAACDNSVPAGGRGYFDPPPPAPINPAPMAGMVSVPAADGPGALPDPNEALARDVTAALAATQPQGGAGLDATQPQGTMPVVGDMGIDPNADSINLNLQSQEEQIRQRAVAQQLREAAQSQLVIVEPEPVPQQDINANVVAFARETTHPVGTKRYNRPAFRDRSQSASVCRRFDSSDDAQRQFLANGGPNTDRYNLDPDGDGFACDFDPEKYRQLQF